MITFRTVDADGVKVFFREAGDPTAPAILLLHGFPSSSHMFRNLIPLLADRFHVVAPDLPGFGFSEAPGRGSFTYTFDRLARSSNASPRQSASSATRSTCSITARRWASVWRSLVPSESQPSSHRTATPTRKASARGGIRSNDTGTLRRRRTAPHSAIS